MKEPDLQGERWPDENKAPFVSSDLAPTSYHCTRTTCDGHHFLGEKDFGRELICIKCGLAVTIGHKPAIKPRRQSSEHVTVTPHLGPTFPWWFTLILGILIGVVLGFMIR